MPDQVPIPGWCREVVEERLNTTTRPSTLARAGTSCAIDFATNCASANLHAASVSSAQVSFRERHARTRLQVFLERDRWPFGSELDRDDQFPRLESSRVRATSGVMRVETSCHARCHAHVVTARIASASDDVDDPQRVGHAVPIAIARCQRKTSESRRSERARDLEVKTKVAGIKEVCRPQSWHGNITDRRFGDGDTLRAKDGLPTVALLVG
jgi:hypothetical protein